MNDFMVVKGCKRFCYHAEMLSLEQVSSGVSPSYHSDVESSTMCEAPTEYAITVRNARMEYRDPLGAFLKGTDYVNVVLKDFNMTVQKGHM